MIMFNLIVSTALQTGRHPEGSKDSFKGQRKL